MYAFKLSIPCIIWFTRDSAIVAARGQIVDSFCLCTSVFDLIMADEAASSAASMKRVIDQWEPSIFRDLVEVGLELDIEPDVEDDWEDLIAATKRLLDKYNATVVGWTTPPTSKVRRALLVVALFMADETTWAPSNDMLVARMLGLLLGDSVRAHIAGVFTQRNGAWKRTEQLNEVYIRSMEQAIGCAAFLFYKLMHANIDRDWDAVFEYMSEVHTEANTANTPTPSTFCKGRKDRPPRALWALYAGRILKYVALRYTGKEKAKELVDTYGAWLKTPQPTPNGTINFEEATLQIDDEAVGKNRLKQIPKSANNYCYCDIPVAIAIKAADEDVTRLRGYLTTTFAGNDAGRFLDAAMEALCYFGIPLPQKMIMLIGNGGDGKSARTILRSNVMGDMHAVISPEVFQKSDEMRIQGCHFAYARALTCQECQAGLALIEDVWKKVVSGEWLSVRPLYGRQTENVKFDCAGKWWECNRTLPSIKGDWRDMKKLKSFSRRLIVVEVESSFTAGTPDPSKRVFKEDATLTTFLQSASCRLAYYQHFLLPFIQRYTAEECRQALSSPPQQILDATRKAVALMANGGIEAPGDSADGLGAGEAESAEKILRAAHAATSGRNVPEHIIAKLKCVPGAWGATKKKADMKTDIFKRAAKEWPFLFLRMPCGGSYMRADFDLAKLDEVMSTYDKRCFDGYIADWGSVFTNKKAVKESQPPEELDIDCDFFHSSDVESEDAGSLLEVVNIVELENYLAEGTDKKLDVLRRTIEAFKQQVQRKGDFIEMAVRYVRKCGIPGRRHADGPSMQKNSRVARSKAFTSSIGGSHNADKVYFDIDIKNCYPTIFLNLLLDIVGDEGLADFSLVVAFVKNYKEWRSMLTKYFECTEKDAKQLLIKLMFLGTPSNDLPLLWGLAFEFREASKVILADARFAYLDGKFGERRNPMASRLHYAIAKVEDAIVSDAENQLRDRSTEGDIEIVTYMFDGGVVRASCDSEAVMKEVLDDVGKRWAVEFTITPFPTELL